MSNPNYITSEGYQRLREEWDSLYRHIRPKLLEEISAAAAQGDRSENAEYIYGKRRLREIDRRLRHLGRRLEDCQVIDKLPASPDKVFFGAEVRLRNSEGKESIYQIVGADEVNPLEGKISKDSPMGQALMGKNRGDDIKVSTPRGERNYVILSLGYPSVTPDGRPLESPGN